MDATLTLEETVSLVQQSESFKKQQVLLRGDKSLPGNVEAVTHSARTLKGGNFVGGAHNMIVLNVQQEMLHAISVGSLDISRWSAT